MGSQILLYGAGCWFVGGDDLTGASLHVLQLQLLPSPPSSLAPIKPADPGSPGKMTAKTERELLYLLCRKLWLNVHWIVLLRDTEEMYYLTSERSLVIICWPGAGVVSQTYCYKAALVMEVSSLPPMTCLGSQSESYRDLFRSTTVTERCVF